MYIMTNFYWNEKGTDSFDRSDGMHIIPEIDIQFKNTKTFDLFVHNH